MNDMRVVLECFRLSFYAVLADLHRCYRSMGSDDVGNRLRLMWYHQDPLDPNNKTYIIIMLLRVTYGDALAATLLEVLLREWIAPTCSNPFARCSITNG